MTVTKAVRLSDEDEKLTNEFLEANPIFDFSTLVRVAIRNFIKNPQIEITPILGPKDRKPEKSSTHGSH